MNDYLKLAIVVVVLFWPLYAFRDADLSTMFFALWAWIMIASLALAAWILFVSILKKL